MSKLGMNKTIIEAVVNLCKDNTVYITFNDRLSELTSV